MSEYLHGFDPKEQKRLLAQARFLEPYVYAGIDLEFQKSLLEVGCGVGAQTKILCRRFPDISVTGLDLNPSQLNAARLQLKPEIKSGQVTLLQADAQSFDLKTKNYDAAFLCWLLEHVPQPLKVLKRVRKHLRSGAKVYCTEVFNQTLFMDPYSPTYLKYWFEFNDLQSSIQGHPFIGAQLGNLLKDAGFIDVQTEVRPFHFDSRHPERRKAFIEYFYQILLSTEKAMLKEGRITQGELKKLKKEVEAVKKDKNAVFFYAFMRATARVP